MDCLRTRCVIILVGLSLTSIWGLLYRALRYVTGFVPKNDIFICENMYGYDITELFLDKLFDLLLTFRLEKLFLAIIFVIKT